MRSLSPRAFLTLLLLSPAFATPAGDTQHQLNTVEDALSETKPVPADPGAAAGRTNSEALSGDTTLFNSIEVPPMKEINGEKFDEETKNGYWYVHTLDICSALESDSKPNGNADLLIYRFVKHYSPYCHHCHDIAPTWQTLYEFYYVSLR